MAMSTITSSIQAQVQCIGQHQYQAEPSSSGPLHHLYTGAPPGDMGRDPANNRSRGPPIGPPIGGGPPDAGGGQPDAGGGPPDAPGGPPTGPAVQGQAPRPSDKFIGQEPQI